MSGVSSERIHISFIPRERIVTPLFSHCDLIEDKGGIRYYLVPQALVGRELNIARGILLLSPIPSCHYDKWK